MTVSATSMSLLIKVQTPRPTVETASVQSSPAANDADARRLVAAITRGNEEAFREFYERYHRRLFRFALVLGRGEETLAQDTVQTAFVTAAKKLRTVQSEEHLWNWLARVARQHLAKAWRQQQRNSAVIGMADVPECMDNGEPDSVLEEYLDAAMLLMEPQERELLERFYFDRQSHKEIAEQSGATPKSVSSRLERARAKLRATITRKLSHET
ncbi:MAG TPA: sigma-70 family RNA polymerase sigma factor [Verrucomicrobiae bacterium]|nr:sigma-70 family RNA polymerase sigma factor [Verrucomicrobiae bacterium]